MIRVIKRDCSISDFNKDKITIAIEKAMKNGSGIYEPQIAKNISDDIENELKEVAEVSIYKIEEMVFDKLVEYNQKETARAYENYRTVREMQRKENTTDTSIEGLIKRTNKSVLKENSNKSANVACTQRDLIAGEVSKDIAKRRLIPAHLVQAHEDRMIHLHDLDYLIQPIFNCFSSDTEFVTNLGVIKFRDCNDGQVVEVIDKNGKWREATVKKYGKNRLQTITLTSGRTEKKIRATKNHRWILKNGEITTDIKVGDRLHLLNETEFEIKNINNDLFCFGFVLGDGNEYINNYNSHGLKVRLCGDKTKHLAKFVKAGYKISKQKFENGDVVVVKTTELSKKDFIDNKCWKYLSKNDKISLFLGYYEADGYKDRNGIATVDKNLAEMIRDISSVAGYHIISEKFEVRDTPFKKNAQLYNFCFIKKQVSNKNWIVKDINRDDLHDYDVWCVEEPITKTFTLANGIVTGNCCLINLKDMLDNGTVINEKRVNSPSCFATACTITTQIMAQVASNQYGGQSITIAHLAPYLRKTYYKYMNLFKDQDNKEEIAKRLTRKELRDGVQTIRYQLSTLQTSNGQLGCL